MLKLFILWSRFLCCFTRNDVIIAGSPACKTAADPFVIFLPNCLGRHLHFLGKLGSELAPSELASPSLAC